MNFISLPNGTIVTESAYNVIAFKTGLQAIRYATPAMAAHFGYIATNSRGELVSVAPEQDEVAV